MPQTNPYLLLTKITRPKCNKLIKNALLLNVLKLQLFKELFDEILRSKSNKNAMIIIKKMIQLGLIKVMVSHDLSGFIVTNQIKFDQQFNS